MAGRSSLVLSLVLLVSCHSLELSPKEKEQETPESVNLMKRGISSVTGPELPALALTWDADLYLVNFSKPQEEKVRQAVAVIKKVIRSSEFRERVLGYTFQGQRQFNDNKGLSNEEIYQTILEGAERIGNTTKNNMMDVELELYHQTTKTIGYTYPNTTRIWMNKKYFNRYTPIKVADNLMHEWMHKLGFTHAVTWSSDRDHTVPYAIGYLLEEIAAKLPE